MLSDRQSLAEEIERLEKELESQHFRALFDRKAEHKKQKHLKKLRRELAELDGTAVTAQPVRRTEPKPQPKPKAPKPPAPAATPAPRTKAAKATVVPAQPASKPLAKAGKTARKPVSAVKKPATKNTGSKARKPAARKKSK